MNMYESIKAYEPVNEQETRDKEIMLKYLASGEDCLTRENLSAHFTTSIWTVNKERTKTLMVYHNLYDSWSWIGGHADGMEDLCAVALKELQEETGYKAGKIEKLVDFFTSPGVVKEKIYIYMASDLTFVGQHLDEDEYLNVKTYAPEEIEHMIANNELKDGKSIIAFELWKNRKSL